MDKFDDAYYGDMPPKRKGGRKKKGKTKSGCKDCAAKAAAFKVFGKLRSGLKGGS